jgi:hypothetical protein
MRAYSESITHEDGNSSDSDVSFWSAISGISSMSESPAKPGDGNYTEKEWEQFE